MNRRPSLPTVPGRGTPLDPPNRFLPLHVDLDPEEAPEGSLRTQYLDDRPRTIISRNQSPDVGFEVSLNPYRGCEHGCIYCYARPSHEYLGLSAGLDFERYIFVRREAPDLLRRELSHPSWSPDAMALSGVTDPYQPIEATLKITRECLKVLAETRHPVSVVTKNRMVIRDLDLLGELAQAEAAQVTVSVTTLDRTLQKVMEPRTATPTGRLDAIRAVAAAGVPVGVNVAPVIPGLTDHELPAILEAAREAGATSATYILVRLPHSVAPLFQDWLGRHFPQRKEKVLARIREMRGGRLNDPRFGSRMKGEGVFAQQLRRLFRVTCRRLGLQEKRRRLSTESFRPPAARKSPHPGESTSGGQLDLFA